MTARDEQETTVTAGRDEEWVSIWTNNPVHARRLDKDPRAEKTKDGPDEFGGWYRIRATDFDPLKGFRRAPRVMTDEQRAAAVERLANARKANHG
jgi:hypothetical protein